MWNGLAFQSSWIFLLVLNVQCQAAKIAVLPWPNGPSHYFMINKIASELESRGHEEDLFKITYYEFKQKLLDEINTLDIDTSQALQHQLRRILEKNPTKAIEVKALVFDSPGVASPWEKKRLVTYVLCSMDPLHVEVKVNKLLYDTPYQTNHLVNKTVTSSNLKKGSPEISDILGVLTLVRDICDLLLLDEGLLSKLRGYDLVFADNSYWGCGQLLQQKVGIPFIVDLVELGFSYHIFKFHYGIPWPVSYIPSDFIPSSTKMSFVQRINNLLLFGVSELVGLYISYNGVGSLKNKHGIAPEKSFSQLIQETDLVLMPVDWALEWSRPVPPNIKMIGSPSPRPAEKLAQDLEDFMQSAGKEGVILVSFGSMVGELSEQQTEILVKAFSQLKYKVLWKYDKTFSHVPNIKTVTWMPQNDILGHPQLRLFVTHGGANSVYEAAYHGIPLLITPLWGDQFGYAQKVQAAGMGSSIDIRVNTVFTAESIVEVINELVEDNKYKTNALHISKILRDRSQTPSQEGADWIEYVLHNSGTGHLLPGGASLPFYQYFLMDVAMFLLVVVSLVVYMFIRFCKCLRKVCSNENKEKIQ